MPRKAVVVALCALSAAIGTIIVPAGRVVSQELQNVYVTNWPKVQAIEGEISVRGPIRQAMQVELKDVVVPPVSPRDTQRLVDGGTITTDGFSEVVLSLTGQVRGELVRPGSVGAILIPDEEPVQRAFADRGEMQFTLEVVASSVSGASPYFASNQPRLPIGFARYRVLLYNTSAKSVTANLFAYLTTR